MSFIDLKDLKNGSIYYSEKLNRTIGYTGGSIRVEIGLSKDIYNTPELFNHELLFNDDYVVIGNVNEEMQLTDYTKNLIKIDKVAFVCNSVSVRDGLLEAIENSTTIKWSDGTAPTNNKNFDGKEGSIIFIEDDYGITYSPSLTNDRKIVAFNQGYIVVNVDKNPGKFFKTVKKDQKSVKNDEN